MTFVVPKEKQKYLGMIYALIFSCFVTAVLVTIGAIVGHTDYYLFLLSNLCLAFIAPIIAWYLVSGLRRKSWLSIWGIVVTLLWLVFLPNSFYMITDLIHTQDSISIDLLYNIVIIMLCVFNSLVAGYISVYVVHRALIKKLNDRYAYLFIQIVLLICSFAIYLGRYLRWNTWDIIFNPAGIIFDVSDTVTSPSTHPEVFTTTVTFFLLLTCMYLVIWQITKLVRKTE